MSALSDLFQNIADAIRSKTGETGTMKPSEFPDKISAIEVGSSSGESKSLTYKTGSITPSSTTTTVIHDMGVIPDIIVVWLDDTTTIVNTVIHMVGYSSNMLNALGGGYICSSTFVVSGGTLSMSTDHGFETTSTNADKYGNIRNVTTESFYIGGSSVVLSSGKSYSWIAISGII